MLAAMFSAGGVYSLRLSWWDKRTLGWSVKFTEQLDGRKRPGRMYFQAGLLEFFKCAPKGEGEVSGIT